MKRALLLASIVAIASFATLPHPALAAEATPAAKPAAKASAPKAAASAPQRKASEAKPAEAKQDRPPTSTATRDSLLMGAFQSEDSFLVTVVPSADGKPNDVLITIVPVTDAKNPRWCQFFGDATVTSASQTKVRVTQYQPRHVHHSIPACSVTLEASKDQLRLTGHSVECESLCLGVPEAYVPKQPLVRLKD